MRITRFLVLALVAIAADLIIPVVYGAALRGKHSEHMYDGDVDMVGHGVLSDQSGHFWTIKLLLLKDGKRDAETYEGRRSGPPPRGFPATRG